MKTIGNVNQAVSRLLTPLTPEKTYEVIADEATRLVDGEDCGIYFRNEKTGEFYVVNKYKSRVLKHRKKGFTYRAYMTGKSFVINQKDILKSHPEVKKIITRSSIFIPLSYRKKTVGVLVVRSKDNICFSGKELAILDLFGSIASLAIRKTQLYSETKNALEMRDLFISMASHELRTPLTSITGFVQLLHKKHVNNHNDDMKWIKHLLWETERLTGLIDKLLSFNKIKARKLDFQFKECSVEEAFFKSLASFKHLHQEREVIVDNYLKKEDCSIIGDRDKLIRVFDNALDNADKFSPEKKAIKLVLEPQNNHIAIRVKDQGKGVPKKELPYIFREFFRGKAARYEGMGLGLYLSRYIIEKHRGSIKIKSRSGKGTELTIKFPKSTI